MRELILQFLSRKKVTLKELQSLIGLLNFACSIIKPGRVFLRRLINLTIGVTKPTYFIRITLEVKKDLRIWQQFLTSFNCQSIFLEEVWTSSSTLSFYRMLHNHAVLALSSARIGHMASGLINGSNKIFPYLSFIPLCWAYTYGQRD